jgi:hypothetical protein
MLASWVSAVAGCEGGGSLVLSREGEETYLDRESVGERHLDYRLYCRVLVIEVKAGRCTVDGCTDGCQMC